MIEFALGEFLLGFLVGFFAFLVLVIVTSDYFGGHD